MKIWKYEIDEIWKYETWKYEIDWIWKYETDGRPVDEHLWADHVAKGEEHLHQLGVPKLLPQVEDEIDEIWKYKKYESMICEIDEAWKYEID